MDRERRYLIGVLALLAGVLAGAGLLARSAQASGLAVGAQSSQTRAIDISEYVPLENGRTWTYQWVVSYGSGSRKTTSRTKSFEGPEFLPTGYAYKFVSDLGDYTLLSVENNTLRMHGTVEPQRSIRFIFDPPVVLYSPDMEPGRRYPVTQQAGREAGMRTWTTVVDGFEDVMTPMGKFSHCLKLRLEMEGDRVKTKATYYYARALGLVVYEYTSWVEGTEKPEITIDARLKLAQVGSHRLTSASQLETLRAEIAAGSTRFDDPEARKVFRQAYERLYFWPARFPGFQVDFTLTRGPGRGGSSQPVTGSMMVTPDLKMKAESGDEQAIVQVETEMSQFITHLKAKPFDEQFAEAIFTFADKDPERGAKIDISAENAMGTSYRIKENKILQIGHSYGRVRFQVDHTKFMVTDDGRFIATTYRITYYSNETNQVVGRVEFKDEYVRVGEYWLPEKRVKTETAKGRTSTLVLEFSNHHIL